MKLETINKIMLGATAVSAIYFGSTFIYPLDTPTNGIVDDINNTFTFTPAEGHLATEHQYRYKLSGNWVSWSPCSTSIIYLPNINIGINELEVRVIGFSRVLTNNQSFTENTPNIAYVEITGNDGTGAVNDISKPFLSIDAACLALSGYSLKKIKIGAGTFSSPNEVNIQSNTVFEGAAKPTVNSDTNPTYLVGGTILKGKFKISKSNVTVKNLGVDVGSAWVALGNTPTDALSMTGTISGGSYTSYTENIISDNVTCLNSSPSALYHAILLEHTINPIMKNIHAYYGVHGVVFKTISGTGFNIKAFGNNYEGLIIKSDASNPDIHDINIDGFAYRKLNGSTESAGQIYIESQYLGAGNPIYDVSIINADLDTRSVQYKTSGSMTNIVVSDLNGNLISNTDNPLMRGIREHFKLDEISGNRLGSHGSVLSDNGGVSSVTGKQGLSAALNSSKYLSIAGFGKLDSVFGKEATINFWVKFNELTTNLSFLFRHSTGKSEYLIRKNANVIQAAVSPDGTTLNFFGNTNVSAGIWYMVTLTSNSLLYLNAALIGNAGTQIFVFEGNSLQIGPSSGTFDGVIDEITFWDRNLSGTEVANLYNAGAGKTYPFS